MMLLSFLAGVTALQQLALVAAAQVAQFQPKSSGNMNISYSLNIPSSTASSNKGPIYFQMKAPSNMQYVALGQGNQMSGSNIFVLYTSSTSNNVTLSPRTGTGHEEPEVNRKAQVTLLEGSGISNGEMVANVRCDNCLSWGGGSIDLKSTTSPWIYSMKSGKPLRSNDVAESISFHDAKGSFKMNLKQAIGGNSDNPFLSNNAVVSTQKGGDSGGSDAQITMKRIAHGIIMAVAFVIMFPLFALALHLVPYNKTVTRIHAPVQLITLCITIIGFGLGISLATDTHKISSGHAILGILIVVYLMLFQPVMGYLQHVHFKKTGQKGAFGIAHRWLGRFTLLLAVINGGLGLQLAGIGTGAPTQGVYAYIIAAVVIGVIYVGVIATKMIVARRINTMPPKEMIRGRI